MHAIRWASTVAVLAILTSAIPSHAAESFGAWLNGRKSRVVDYRLLPKGHAIQNADLGDGIDARLDRRHGTLSIRRGRRLLWRGNLSRIRPWKLVAADVRGDGVRDIVLGVYKSTRYFPYPHPCLFVFRWDGKGIVPVWRGSNLGEPFVDFTFVGKSDKVELVSVEFDRDGRRSLAGYHWNYFGFTGDWRRGPWRRLTITSTGDRSVDVRADGKRVRVDVSATSTSTPL